MLVFHRVAKLCWSGSAAYGMFLPDVMIHISPERGATHATGVLISPVPNWIVGPYGSRDCASSCGAAASISTTPAIHATPGRIVRIGPPKLGVITVPLQDARRRAGSRNRGDSASPATMATAPYAAYDRDGEHCGRCKRHALHRPVQLSTRMDVPTLDATRRKTAKSVVLQGASRVGSRPSHHRVWRRVRTATHNSNRFARTPESPVRRRRQ